MHLSKKAHCVVVQGFPPFDLAQLMWAYVRLGYIPEGNMLERVCQVAVENLDNWTADGLALLSWSMSKLNYVDFPSVLLSSGIKQFTEHNGTWPGFTRMISASAT